MAKYPIIDTTRTIDPMPVDPEHGGGWIPGFRCPVHGYVSLPGWCETRQEAIDATVAML